MYLVNAYSFAHDQQEWKDNDDDYDVADGISGGSH